MAAEDEAASGHDAQEDAAGVRETRGVNMWRGEVRGQSMALWKRTHLSTRDDGDSHMSRAVQSVLVNHGRSRETVMHKFS